MPKLALSILISRNLDGVKRCLDSVRPILDSVSSELILTDTGCGEEVRALLEEYASDYSDRFKIIDFEWIKDFSAARNEGLEVAKADNAEWFLYIDDDEWFEDTAEIIDFFNSGKCNNYNVAYYVQRNYLDAEGSEYADVNVDRIIRITSALHFEHRVHEAYTGVDIGTKCPLNAFVHHYGYVYADEEEKFAKSRRNRELLELEVAECPDDMRMRYQLVMDCYSTHDYELAIDNAKQAIEHGIKIKTNSQYWDAIHTEMLYCYKMQGDWDSVISYGEEFLARNLFPYDEFGTKQYLIEAYYNVKRFDGAVTLAPQVIDTYIDYKNSPTEYDKNQLLRNEFWQMSNISKMLLYIIESAANVAATDPTSCDAIWDALNKLNESIGDNSYGDATTIKYCVALSYDIRLRYVNNVIAGMETYDQLEYVLGLMTAYADEMMYYCEYHYGDALASMGEQDLAPMERIAWVIQGIVNSVDAGDASAAINGVRTMMELAPQWVDAIGFLPTYVELVCGSDTAGRTDRIKMIQGDGPNSAESTYTKDVVFLPYKASMWDSLEGAWREANDDPNINAIVIPIPYIDKNPDGSAREIHYEGNEFPDYVPVVDFRTYDLAVHHPAAIYIHNPYDAGNFVTSVHPDYYSDKLRDYTDELIYIPYFVLGDVDPNNKEALEGVKYLIITNVMKYAHRVIVWSEDWRQAYINVMSDFVGEDTRQHWENIIEVKESSKLARARNLTKADYLIPPEWADKITKPDGSRRKIIFYNTSVETLLDNDDKMIDKIERVLKIFEENKDDVTLLWRPHPLMEATLTSMRPDLWAKYNKIVDTYRNAGWGIFDDTPQLERAIAISDAYYGDPSSVVWMYKETGKPIMIQNSEV